MSNKLIGADYLLLLLYLNNKEPIKGAVKLIKMMFLFNEQIASILKNKGLESEKLPHFIAYSYGPFSKDVYEQIELFSSIGFVKITNLNVHEEMAEVDDIVEAEFIDESYENDIELKSDNNFLEYCIDKSGIEFVEKELIPILTTEHRDILCAFKKKITDMPIRQLLYYVYSTYPEFTEKSLIKDEVLGDGK